MKKVAVPAAQVNSWPYRSNSYEPLDLPGTMTRSPRSRTIPALGQSGVSMSVSAKELKRRLKLFQKRCRESGIRLTYQRLEVFKEVACSDEHPDVETIFERVRTRLPTVSLDTVYRTLSLLEQEGLLSKVDILCDRARFDANMDPHHHFICTMCGLVNDFYSPQFDNVRIPAEVSAMGTPRSTHVEVRGICRTCGKKAD